MWLKERCEELWEHSRGGPNLTGQVLGNASLTMGCCDLEGNRTWLGDGRGKEMDGQRSSRYKVLRWEEHGLFFAVTGSMT